MKSNLRSGFVLSALALSVLAAFPMSASAKKQPPHFQRIATYLVCENTSCDRNEIEETVAEITTVSSDGNTLIYTDSPNNLIGFVNITNPAMPTGLGTVDVGGEPTSVAVAGNYVLVAVNTSESFVSPSGYLAVYDLSACLSNVGACTPVREIDMGGQPDSVAVSGGSARYAAVVVENERDEDLKVGDLKGGLPQLPAGFLNIVDIKGAPADWAVRMVDLTGLAAYGASDPEPEYVSINKNNIAAVSMQENNHIVMVNLVNGKIINNFSAGTVNLTGVNINDNKLLEFNDSLSNVPREPDAIAWLGTDRVVTANEGDLFGGSRGFTVFNRNGNVNIDSGTSFEYLAARIGHYPEKRADNKGAEPEGVAVGKFGKNEYIFVGSERGNFVGVYTQNSTNSVNFVQALPTGAGPEGLLPIPQRNLFVASTEVDAAPLRSQINIYRLQDAAPAYPQIQSAIQSNGKPITWGALSGLVADSTKANTLYTVHDSFYNKSRIYTVNVSAQPAVIRNEIVLMKDSATVNYDLEGIAQRSNGGFWLASEGAGTSTTRNMIIAAAADGTVQSEVRLPASVEALQQSNGFEGVAVTGTAGVDEKVYVAFQREWTADPAGKVRVGVYTPADTTWKFFYYPLDAVSSPAGGWVGLSEITSLGGNRFAIIERDNQAGPDASIKRVYSIDVTGVTPKTQEEGGFPTLSKNLVIDVLPEMQAAKGWVHDKLEGLAVTTNGTVYVVTDNDGVDKSTGETQFLNLGKAFETSMSQ